MPEFGWRGADPGQIGPIVACRAGGTGRVLTWAPSRKVRPVQRTGGRPDGLSGGRRGRIAPDRIGARAAGECCRLARDRVPHRGVGDRAPRDRRGATGDRGCAAGAHPFRVLHRGSAGQPALRLRLQLRGAIARMAEEGAGVLLYLAQEGRNIGLVNKLRAYTLQDRGLDTLDANRALGWGADERNFLIAATMLEALGVSRVRLLTNNPYKLAALASCGVEVVGREAHAFAPNGVNDHYLAPRQNVSATCWIEPPCRRWCIPTAGWCAWSGVPRCTRARRGPARQARGRRCHASRRAAAAPRAVSRRPGAGPDARCRSNRSRPTDGWCDDPCRPTTTG